MKSNILKYITSIRDICTSRNGSFPVLYIVMNKEKIYVVDIKTAGSSQKEERMDGQVKGNYMA